MYHGSPLRAMRGIAQTRIPRKSTRIIRRRELLNAERPPHSQQHLDEESHAPRPQCCRGWLYPVWEFYFIFMETSSIHGFNHLTSKKRSSGEHVFWVVTMLLALYGAIAIGLSTWERYQENPVVLTISRQQLAFTLASPSCTLCPENRKDEEKLVEIAAKYKNNEEVLDFLNTLMEASYETFDKFNKFNRSFEEVLKPSEYQNFFLSNAFDFELETVDALTDKIPTVRILTEMGYCTSYLARGAGALNPESWKPNKTIITDMPYHDITKLTYDKFGLQYTNINSPSKVFTLGPEETPDVGQRYERLKDVTFLDYYMVALSTITTPQAKQLSIPQRRCRLREESDLSISPIYSFGLCRMECRMRFAQELCGCIPFFYRIQGNYKVCDVNGMKCLGKHKDHLTLLVNQNKKKLQCNCLPVCDTFNYIKEDVKNYEWFMGSSLKYTISRFPNIEIRRDIVFGFTDVLVSIGGTAGLFLGCSVLSLIEIVYFFTLRMFWYIVFKIKAKRSEK